MNGQIETNHAIFVTIRILISRNIQQFPFEYFKTSRAERNGMEWNRVEWSGTEHIIPSIVWIFYDKAEQSFHSII